MDADEKGDVRRYLVQITSSFDALAKMNGREEPPRGPMHFVLERGRKYESAKLTEDEAAQLQSAIECATAMGVDVREFKQCYANAQRLVQMCPEGVLTYCEGYAVGRAAIPVMHGWVTLNDKVIDLTWRPETRGVIEDGLEYFGVEFPAEVVVRKWLATEMAGTLIDDFDARWPMLKLRPDQDVDEATYG